MFSLGDKIGISFKNDKGELAAAILTVTKITTPKEAVIEGTVEQSVADKNSMKFHNIQMQYRHQ